MTTYQPPEAAAVPATATAPPTVRGTAAEPIELAVPIALAEPAALAVPAAGTAPAVPATAAAPAVLAEATAPAVPAAATAPVVRGAAAVPAVPAVATVPPVPAAGTVPAVPAAATVPAVRGAAAVPAAATAATAPPVPAAATAPPVPTAPPEPTQPPDPTAPPTPPRPWALLAELTHACPLHCPYCSNPLELARRSVELSAEQWGGVLRQAAALGVVHTHLSGGEPLLRPDLERIVAAAEGAGIYTQLVTSGTGLDEARLTALRAAGLRSVQLSVQHADAAANDRIARRPSSFAAKERAAALVRRAGLPLGLNVVLHRDNLDAVDALIDLGEAWGVDRIELANAQFYGWGLLNRAALLPTRDQLARARETVERRRERLAGRIDLVWVVPDYFDGVAKPCMGGWGAVSLTVAPDGAVLPCPAAASLPDLDPPNVRDHPLDWIWDHSPAFGRFRGTAWMTGPCGGCPRREEDFGGCRCQAYALTGDAARTDPACALSPDHHLVRTLTDAEAQADAGPGGEPPPYVYRRPGAVGAR